ncbi:hypothetical protein Pint_06329 [Pistacia integerrima]|uniref:Uncharacterized protein n=1 Tax=Pistacia integerrima TaxID=434235 RepID=A0ACC0ZAQ1_9ROSI|nr:hypothetical protein Pint_06329 [Pistacia integerrima]
MASIRIRLGIVPSTAFIDGVYLNLR